MDYNNINNNIVIKKKSFLDKSVIVSGWYKFCLGIMIMVLLNFSNINRKISKDHLDLCFEIFYIISSIIVLFIITLWIIGLYNIIHILLLIFILLLIIYSFIQQSQEYQNVFKVLYNNEILVFSNAFKVLIIVSTLFIMILLFYYHLSEFDKE